VVEVVEVADAEQLPPRIAREAASARIGRAVAKDLSQRSGLGGIWATIDPKIKDEIIFEWSRIILRGMP
jgi:hypothetical protein